MSARLPVPAAIPGWPEDPDLDRLAAEGSQGPDGWFEGHREAVAAHARWVALVESRLRRYDLPRQQLASAIGVAPNTLTTALNGKSWPRMELVVRINTFLDIDMEPRTLARDPDTFGKRRGEERWGDWRHRQRDGVHVDAQGTTVRVEPSPPPRREHYGAREAGYEQGWKEGFYQGRRNPDDELVDQLVEVTGLLAACLASRNDSWVREQAQSTLEGFERELQASIDTSVAHEIAKRQRRWAHLLDQA
jgi:transcriptional regulator with XRE-family HTH domain